MTDDGNSPDAEFDCGIVQRAQQLTVLDMTQARPEPVVRSAGREDACAVFEALVELAPEIGVRLERPGQESKLYDLVESACAGRSSWVSCDDRKVVAFLLGQPNALFAGMFTYLTERSSELDTPIVLLYGGTIPAWRGQGRFSRLLRLAQQLGKPLAAQVLASNDCRIRESLRASGFRSADIPHDSDWFV